MKIKGNQRTNREQRRKSKKNRTNLNYDNRPLTDDETLVLYFKNESDIANLKNPDSIVSFMIGRTRVTAVLTAFKKGEEAETARKQFNSYINDLNGHFHCAKTTSLDKLAEDYELEKGSANGDPAISTEMLENVTLMVKRLTNEAPQLMAAVFFHRAGYFGKDFEKAMRISHDRSATIQNKLTHVLHAMMTEGYDAVDLNVRATKHDDYYKSVILEHMNELLDDLMEMYNSICS